MNRVHSACGSIPVENLSALIARLVAAEAGSRELDAHVEVAVRAIEAAKNGLAREHWAVWHASSSGIVRDGATKYASAPYTTSLDAALALAERVLPGWHIGIQPWFHTDPDRVMSRAYLIRPDWKRWNPVGDEWCEQHHGRSCATPALAVSAAILRTKLDRYEAEGEVNKNPKAQEV